MSTLPGSTLPENAPADPAKPVKRRRRWPWVVGVVAAFGVGIAAGQGTGSTTTTTNAAAPVAAPSTVTQTVTAPAPAPVAQAPATVTQTVTAPPVTITKDAPAPAAAPAPAPSGTVGDGVHHVGTDMPAGQWKTTGPTDGLGCYWARLKNDSGDFNAIIANGLVQGPTSVTVKSGEYLELSGGCTWTH